MELTFRQVAKKLTPQLKTPLTITVKSHLELLSDPCTSLTFEFKYIDISLGSTVSVIVNFNVKFSVANALCGVIESAQIEIEITD